MQKLGNTYLALTVSDVVTRRVVRVSIVSPLVLNVESVKDHRTWFYGQDWKRGNGGEWYCYCYFWRKDFGKNQSLTSVRNRHFACGGPVRNNRTYYRAGTMPEVIDLEVGHAIQPDGKWGVMRQMALWRWAAAHAATRQAA